MVVGREPPARPVRPVVSEHGRFAVAVLAEEEAVVRSAPVFDADLAFGDVGGGFERSDGEDRPAPPELRRGAVEQDRSHLQSDEVEVHAVHARGHVAAQRRDGVESPRGRTGEVEFEPVVRDVVARAVRRPRTSSPGSGATDAASSASRAAGIGVGRGPSGVGRQPVDSPRRRSMTEKPADRTGLADRLPACGAASRSPPWRRSRRRMKARRPSNSLAKRSLLIASAPGKTPASRGPFAPTSHHDA